MANTTWNPSDLSNVTLTNSNLTATVGTGANGGVRAADSHSSGQYYFECKWTLNTNTITSGLALSTASLIAASTGWVRVSRVTGDIIIGVTDTGTSINSASPIPQNSIIGCAVDLSAQLVWFRIAPSGNWNGSGTANPATGTGGISISAVSGALFPGMAGGSADVVLANFGGSAFSGTVPSGFTSGWPTAVVTGTLAITEASDTFAFAGSDANTGTLSVTEAADTFAFAGKDANSGTLSVTELADTFSFNGADANTGTLAVTEAADTFLFAGSNIVSGTLSVTEAPDIFAFSGAIVEGSLSVTEAADVFAFSGTDVANSGTLSVTEAADTFLFSGTVAPPPPQPGPQIAFPLRERTYRRRFVGLGYDPKFVISKDRPGPLRIIEFVGEIKE